MKKNNAIPRIIWLYWEQGWDNAPKLIQECKKSWEFHNQNWDIRCLDKVSVLEFFDIEKWIPGSELKPNFLTPARKWLHKKLHRTQLIKNKKLSVQGRSDIIRINLLSKYGGVWADATLFCRQPLDGWIDPHIKQNFFAFSNPGKNLALMDGSLPIFTSYFLIAEKNNYIVKRLNKSMQEYWRQRNCMDQYLWIFALFNELYNKDDEFSALWDKVVKVDAPIPDKGVLDKVGGVEFFACQTIEELSDLSQGYKEMLNNSKAPMFKLSNKKKYSPDNASRIYLLFKSK